MFVSGRNVMSRSSSYLTGIVKASFCHFVDNNKSTAAQFYLRSRKLANVSSDTRTFSYVGYIKYAGKFLPLETLRMLHLGLVEPNFRCFYSVWGSCGTVLRQKIEKLQNRDVRIIKFSPYNAKTSPLLTKLRLPGIQDMIQQETVGMVYKGINSQAPEYLSVLFNRVSAYDRQKSAPC